LRMSAVYGWWLQVQGRMLRSGQIDCESPTCRKHDLPKQAHS